MRENCRDGNNSGLAAPSCYNCAIEDGKLRVPGAALSNRRRKFGFPDGFVFKVSGKNAWRIPLRMGCQLRVICRVSLEVRFPKGAETLAKRKRNYLFCNSWESQGARSSVTRFSISCLPALCGVRSPQPATLMCPCPTSSWQAPAAPQPDLKAPMR